MWIEKEEKSKYLDSSKQGLRLRFQEEINTCLKTEVLEFCKWLRKLFWFPIRCNIVFLNKEKFKSQSAGEFCLGIFFHNEETYKPPYKKKKPPTIYIASKLSYKKDMNQFFQEIIQTIAHELTHYFQWYFYEFEKRTDLSLEREANSWARYLVSTYLEEKSK